MGKNTLNCESVMELRVPECIQVNGILLLLLFGHCSCSENINKRAGKFTKSNSQLYGFASSLVCFKTAETSEESFLK